jgi:hypothetical protein
VKRDEQMLASKTSGFLYPSFSLPGCRKERTASWNAPGRLGIVSSGAAQLAMNRAEGRAEQAQKGMMLLCCRWGWNVRPD